LFVLLILAHDRRRVLHFNVTSNPSAEWTAQQVVQAFPNDSAQRYLLRDRDSIYGFEQQPSIPVGVWRFTLEHNPEATF
jgi:putative transposase